MSTMLLKPVMKPTWEELRNPESKFHDFNPSKEEGEVPLIYVSDEDKQKMRKFDVNFEARVEKGQLICEFDIYTLVKNIEWSEALYAKPGDGIPVYLINDEFVLVPWVNPSCGAVYRLSKEKN